MRRAVLSALIVLAITVTVALTTSVGGDEPRPAPQHHLVASHGFDPVAELPEAEAVVVHLQSLEAQRVGEYLATTARAEFDAWLASFPAPTPPRAAPAAPSAQAPQSVSTQVGGPCGGDLPPCYVKARESGGDYGAQNPTSSASGAWQFLDSTWGGYGGYARAADAPPDVQDARARELWAGGAGCSHWSAC